MQAIAGARIKHAPFAPCVDTRHLARFARAAAIAPPESARENGRIAEAPAIGDLRNLRRRPARRDDLRKASAQTQLTHITRDAAEGLEQLVEKRARHAGTGRDLIGRERSAGEVLADEK